MARRVNPAVVAGLFGAGAVAAPQTAQAMPTFVTDISATVFSSPQISMACGFAAGVIVTGAGVAIGRAVAAHARRADDYDVPDLRAASSSAYKAAPADDMAAFFSAAPAEVAEKPARASHFKAAAPQQAKPVQVSNAAQVKTPAASKAASVAASAAPAPRSHAATDYEEIADNYVKRNTFKERMAVRAAGVAETLRSRIDAERMSDMPVITRADGSVGDVGTGWWTATVGQDAISSNKGFAEDSSDLEIPSDFTNPGAGKFFEEAHKKSTAARSIAARVAYVDQGVYPEKRSVADLSAGKDDWEKSLRSMDENIATESGAPKVVVAASTDTGAMSMPVHAAFFDNIGSADTLDEPDNMAGSTAFLMFKTPAGHPEVKDTESYVDYLIGDEFKRNSSRAARKSSANFLRLVQGGTQSSKTGSTGRLSGSTGSRALYVGKHFAVNQAQEA